MTRTSFLSGLGTFALAVADEIVKEQERQQKQKEEQIKQAARAEIERQQKETLDRLFGEKEEEEKESVTFVYSLKSLNEMTVTQLKSEVWSVYKENDKLFSDTYELGQEARKLYFMNTSSNVRYRAQLIKFLLEKGNI